MPSNINPYSIDGTFPIANQDNSSQGFRDNFTNIRNNLLFAENEISDLQSKALVTSALTGQTLTNDMGGTQIRRPQLAAWTQTLLDLGAVGGSISLDFNQANFQKITTAAPVSIQFINWPATYGSGSVGYGSMRIWVNITNASHTIQLPHNEMAGTGVIIADNVLAGYQGNGLLTFDVPGNYVFDISSVDSGNSFLIFDITRNRSTFRDPELYYNGAVNSTFLVGYGTTALPLALALERGEDKISVRGSYNSVSANANYTGNVYYTQGDEQPTAGYSVSGFRGNLDAGVLAPVLNNDFIGYVNVLSMTGDGTDTGNTIQSLAGINFFATGSNVQAGLGGNIAIFTAPDKTGSQGFLRTQQAVGIENDQSVKFFGNVITGNTFVPTTSTTAGGVAGQISFDADYIYICIAPGNWKRTTLGTF